MGVPTPNDFFVWLGCAAFAVWLINQTMSFWKGLTRGVQEDPRPALTYQTLTMCRTMHESSSTRLADIERAMQERIVMLSNAISKMQDKQDKVLEALIRLEKR